MVFVLIEPILYICGIFILLVIAYYILVYLPGHNSSVKEDNNKDEQDKKNEKDSEFMKGIFDVIIKLLHVLKKQI